MFIGNGRCADQAEETLKSAWGLVFIKKDGVDIRMVAIANMFSRLTEKSILDLVIPAYLEEACESQYGVAIPDGILKGTVRLQEGCRVLYEQLQVNRAGPLQEELVIVFDADVQTAFSSTSTDHLLDTLAELASREDMRPD